MTRLPYRIRRRWFVGAASMAVAFVSFLLAGCSAAGPTSRPAVLASTRPSSKSAPATDTIHNSPMALIRYAHEACVRTDLASLLKCVEPSLAPDVKAMFEALRDCRDLEDENVRLVKRRFAAEVKAQFGPDAFDPSDWVGHGHWWAVWCGFTPFPHSLPTTAKKLVQPVEKPDWGTLQMTESGDEVIARVKDHRVFSEDWAIRRISGGWYFTFTDTDKMWKGWVDQAEEFRKYATFLKSMNEAMRKGKIRNYREYDEETKRYWEKLEAEAKQGSRLRCSETHQTATITHIRWGHTQPLPTRQPGDGPMCEGLSTV